MINFEKMLFFVGKGFNESTVRLVFYLYFNENVTKIFTLIIFLQLQRFIFIEKKNFRKKYLRMKIIPREKKIL